MLCLFHADNRQNNASYSYRKSNNAIWTWWSSKKTLAIVMKTPQKSYLSKGKVESLFFVDSKFNRCRWVAFLNIVLECIALASHTTGCLSTWWRHQMETFSASLVICAGNSPVPGEFPAQRLGTRSFDVFFDLCLNKRLNKQSWCWWFETLSRPLWRHCSEQFIQDNTKEHNKAVHHWHLVRGIR